MPHPSPYKIVPIHECCPDLPLYTRGALADGKKKKRKSRTHIASPLLMKLCIISNASALTLTKACLTPLKMTLHVVLRKFDKSLRDVKGGGQHGGMKKRRRSEVQSAYIVMGIYTYFGTHATEKKTLI